VWRYIEIELHFHTVDERAGNSRPHLTCHDMTAAVRFQLTSASERARYIAMTSSFNFSSRPGPGTGAGESSGSVT
jgi:hypothetical protein